MKKEINKVDIFSLEKVRNWEEMKKKGLRMNAGKTKNMWGRPSMGQAEDSGEPPCDVCRKGVGDNSICCLECRRWVHRRCSGISGELKSNVDFHCRRCLEGQSVLLKEVAVEPTSGRNLIEPRAGGHRTLIGHFS